MTDFIIRNLYELAGGIACAGLGLVGIVIGALYMLAPAWSLGSRLGTNAKTVRGVRQEGLWLTLGSVAFLAAAIYLLTHLSAE